MSVTAEKKLTLPDTSPTTEATVQEKITSTHPKFFEWCVSEQRIKNLKKELDKQIAMVKARVPDASYRIDTEINVVYFEGGVEKQVCTTLIQPDKAILSLFISKKIFYTQGHKVTAIDKLTSILNDKPEMLDKLLAFLEKDKQDGE